MIRLVTPNCQKKTYGKKKIKLPIVKELGFQFLFY